MSPGRSPAAGALPDTIQKVRIGDMSSFVISARRFDLDREAVERAVEGVLPEPLHEHYVVVGGRRYPPKQVLVEATGLDRADFTTHQARRILTRLGFSAGRSSAAAAPLAEPAPGLPHGGRMAAALEPYVGKWVALDSPTEVLVAADSPQEVLAWLARHGRRAGYGMFRVPTTEWEAGGLAPL
jgi:hypothetical protein